MVFPCVWIACLTFAIRRIRNPIVLATHPFIP